MPLADPYTLEQRFFPAFDLSVPPIERHPQGTGLHDAFVNQRLYLRSLPLSFGRAPEAVPRNFLASSVMLNSSLWKAIDEQWGPTDGMVDGKHHQARLFAFSFEDRTVLCTTETGDRGSSWFLVERVLGPREPGTVGAIPLPEDDEVLKAFWHPFIVAFVHQVKHHPAVQGRWRRALDAVAQRETMLAAAIEPRRARIGT